MYNLADLIDIAERNNAETRVGLERARQAAAAVGLSESAYYPFLVASAAAGYDRAFIPFPALTANPTHPSLSNVRITGGGSLVTEAQVYRGELSAKWLLLDFGERSAVVAAAREQAAAHPSKPKGPFVSDAFTNPAHVHFTLKVTFAAMFCYIVYEAIDWSGIHTALITCTFIALESTEATLYKGTLRIVGCVIGGALALFSIVFLMPHMETVASLVVLVPCASAIAGWVATGSERISYAGLQIAFAFFYSVYQGYAPDTDLDNVRNRVVGILFGLVVTGFVFQYIWPERERIESASAK